MKLLFPNGEHEPLELSNGVVVVGTGSDCQLMLTAPGIALHHCELQTNDDQTMVVPVDNAATTVLNGRQIVGESPIKPGDLLLFARVGCRVVATEKAATPAHRPAAMASGDDGRTRVRMALPKFLLRGVSGPTFGKTYAVVGTLIVGRSSECDIAIASDEISRHHAKLQVTPDGVVIEDMGSANGSFVNNQRIHAPTLLKAGDELRLDTVRFLLMSPGMEAHPAATARTEPAAQVIEKKTNSVGWIVLALILLAAVAVAALHYMGKI
ncbi:MAG: FHA domain-containing protein [Rudaea sp.]